VKTPRHAALAVLVGTALSRPVAVAAPAVPSLSQRQVEAVRQGRVVLVTRREPGDEGKANITGVVEIRASHEKVWPLLLDPRHSIASSKAVKRVDVTSDTTSGAERVMMLSWHLKVALSTWVYHTRRVYHASERTMSWTLDRSKPNDIAWTEGSYSTHDAPTPGAVTLVYRSKIDTGKAIPQWLEEDLTESSLKKYMQYVKKVAEGG